MSGMNGGRILVGGLLAGVVANVGYGISEWLMAAELERLVTRLGLATPGGATMMTLALLGFGIGTLAVWLYASMVPRYGARPRTALLAGGAVWALACFVPNVSLLAFGILTPAHFGMASAADLIVVPAATLAGSRLYREANGVREPAAAALVTGG